MRGYDQITLNRTAHIGNMPVGSNRNVDVSSGIAEAGCLINEDERRMRRVGDFWSGIRGCLRCGGHVGILLKTEPGA